MLSLLIPISSGLSSEAIRVLALCNLMLVLWLTEALPLAVTALLPIIILPMSGVMTVQEAANPYASSIIYLFMGGFMLACAIEKWGLHRRVALLILKRIGLSYSGIVAALMISTALISMWISNTATAVIMLPIAVSLIQVVSGTELPQGKTRNNLAISCLLAVAYAANMGGVGTLIGTPPNMILAGLYKNMYGADIDFLKWMLVGVPVLILTLVPAFFLLTRVFFPFRLEVPDTAQAYVDSELAQLGKLSRGERHTLWVFGLAVLLWIFGSWINRWAGYSLLSDPAVALIASILLFVVPGHAPNKPLLTWSDTQQIPWGILLFFGGALSLANGLETSGFIEFVGHSVQGFTGISPFWLVGLCVIGMLFITEFMGSTPLATVFVPLLFGLADGFGMEKLSLAVPVIIATSGAFMFPMATPPNAIVFASGYVRVQDMARVGLVMNLVCSLVVWLVAYGLVTWLF
ncbi:MAG: DASS family sodium-coupled anion symporter [Cytophagales bacterium]|nr:DASS family sodium-coupled anion symporter [Cytophagales bacterium]